MVGSAISRNLQQKGFQNIVFRTLEELDLTNQQATQEFFENEKPEHVVLAAAKVGGIVANNTYRADFIMCSECKVRTKNHSGASKKYKRLGIAHRSIGSD